MRIFHSRISEHSHEAMDFDSIVYLDMVERDWRRNSRGMCHPLLWRFVYVRMSIRNSEYSVASCSIWRHSPIIDTAHLRNSSRHLLDWQCVPDSSRNALRLSNLRRYGARFDSVVASDQFMLAGRTRNYAFFGLAFAFGCAATLAMVLVLSPRNETPTSATPLSLPSIADCVSRSGILAREEKLSVALVKEVQSLCYDQIYGQGLLNDFQLRRLAFVEQAKAETVILWMVVIITLSGVLIAGLQVLASYKLAVAGNKQFESSELSIERDKLSVKSSIAGLFILVISFAFFYVFVFEVFKIHPIDADGKVTSSQPAYVGEMNVAPAPSKPTSAK